MKIKALILSLYPGTSPNSKKNRSGLAKVSTSPSKDFISFISAAEGITPLRDSRFPRVNIESSHVYKDSAITMKDNFNFIKIRSTFFDLSGTKTFTFSTFGFSSTFP